MIRLDYKFAWRKFFRVKNTPLCVREEHDVLEVEFERARHGTPESVRVRRRGEGCARSYLLSEAILLHGVSPLLCHPHCPGRTFSEQYVHHN